MHRKLIGWVLAGIAFGSISFALLQLYTIWDKSQSRTTPFRVTVSGEGKIDATPDIASLMGSVITTAKTAPEAEQQNSQKATAVVNYLKTNGVDQKDIKTGQFSVNPQYQYSADIQCEAGKSCPPRKPPEIVSYEVRNSVTVKVRDLKKAGDLLSGMIAAGANDVNGPRFSIDDPNAVEAQARQKAIANAKEKAAVLAKDLGLKLGKVVDFNEGGGAGYQPYALQKSLSSSGATPTTLPIEPGSQDVRITVSVTYELR